MERPDYYLPVMPYLVLKNAGQFIEFTRTVFGAIERLVMPRADGAIMHAEISIGKATIMAADANKDDDAFPGSMFILLENIDDIYTRAIANGARSLREPGDLDYGRSAGFMDPFGNMWWVTEA